MTKRFNWLNMMLVVSMLFTTPGTLLAQNESSSVPTESESTHQIFLPLISTGVSDSHDAQIPDDIAEALATSQSYDQAIRAMEQHISITEDGLLSLDLVSAASLDGVDDAIFQSLYQSMEATNEKIRAGELNASDIHFLTRASDSTKESVSSAALGQCKGRSETVQTFYGYANYLDSCETAQLAGATLGGGVALEVCEKFLKGRSGLACSIIKWTSYGWAALITWMNAKGDGIIIHFQPYPLPISWMMSQ